MSVDDSDRIAPQEGGHVLDQPLGWDGLPVKGDLGIGAKLAPVAEVLSTTDVVVQDRDPRGQSGSFSRYRAVTSRIVAE
jgi:hypothetical protein